MLSPSALLHYFRLYRKYVGRRFVIVFVLALLGTLVEGFGISLALPLIASLDDDLAGPEGGGVTEQVQNAVNFLGLEGSTVGIIALIAFLVGLKGLVNFCANAYSAHLSAQLLREITTGLFGYYARMNYAYYTSRNTGHFTNLLGSQIPRFVRSFGAFKALLAALVTTFGYIAVALFIDWRFALMASVAGGLVLLVYRRLNSYVKELSRRTAAEQKQLSGSLVQTIQAYKYVASTASIQPLRRTVHRSVSLLTHYNRNQGIANSLTMAVREPLSIGIILIVLIVQIEFFNAPLAPIFVSLVLLYRAMGNMLFLQTNVQSFLNTVGAVEHVEDEFREVSAALEPSGGSELPPFSGSIDFENVNYRYDSEGPAVLRGISLSIPSRHTVAFVGPSGAGKSTLVDLITLLLRPTSGQVLIDGALSSDIAVQSWRRQIGYVSQDTVVFDDTVANNIGLWKGDFDEDAEYRERILAAAEMASAREFIENLPEGFNTKVGDRGVRLSGGQRQRLFIARELFKKPRLLILDEATSALDSASEKAIQASIDRLKGQTTIVMIAHRLSTIKSADTVYVLKDGSIVETGSYEELAGSTDSHLGRMVALQSL